MRNLLSLVMVLAVFALPAACTRTTEVDKVRKIIASVQKAAEEKNIRTVREHLSRTYRDPKGYDYDGIKGLLAFYFYRHRTVSVYISGLEATVNGQDAEARFQALLTARGTDGGEAGMFLPDALGAYDFNVSFRKEEDGWKIVSADWRRGTDGGDAE